jgi:hypothetical protein
MWRRRRRRRSKWRWRMVMSIGTGTRAILTGDTSTISSRWSSGRVGMVGLGMHLWGSETGIRTGHGPRTYLTICTSKRQSVVKERKLLNCDNILSRLGIALDMCCKRGGCWFSYNVERRLAVYSKHSKQTLMQGCTCWSTGEGWRSAVMGWGQ